MTRWDLVEDAAHCFRPYLGTGGAPDAVGNPAFWPAFVPYASAEYLVPALGVALANDGRLSAEVAEYLEVMLDLNRARNAKLRKATSSLASAFNAIGVQPVLLKGSATFASGLYADSGFRMMVDLDLLVPPERILDCAAAAANLGFRPRSEVDRHAFRHYPGLEDANGVLVELHRTLVAQRHERLAPADRLVARAQPRELDGAAVLVPSPTDFALHTIVHNELTHNAHLLRQASVRTLLEIAALQQTDAPPDWDDIRHTFRAAGRERVIDDVMALVGHLFDVPMPVDGDARARTVEAYRRATRQRVAPALRVMLSEVDRWGGAFFEDPRRIRRIVDPAFLRRTAADLLAMLRST